MQYAAGIPRTPPQLAAVGVAALLGAGAALGIAAIAEEDSVPTPDVKVVVAQPPAEPTAGANEAHTAAAIGTQEGSVAGGGPDETATAVAIRSGQGL